MRFLRKFAYLVLGGISIAACGSALMLTGGWGASGPSGIACIGGLLTIMPFFYAGELYPPFFHIMDYLSKLPPPSGSVLIYFILPAIVWTIVLSVLCAAYSLVKNQFVNKKLKIQEKEINE